MDIRAYSRDGEDQKGVIDARSRMRRVTRVEPKVYLANERTFINWLTMAVKIGSVASALAGVYVCACGSEDLMCAGGNYHECGYIAL
jgi:uncharacterized membrane protein YidH (DUF202 family)